MKRGLVMEGGGMRGLFTEGVVDAFLAEGIEFDGMVGVSAGALFGCNFKSCQPQRALRYNLRFRGDSRYMGFTTFLKTGNYVSAEFAYYTVPLELDIIDNDAFRANPAEFHVVSTDIVTGQPFYQQIDSIDASTLEWFRATSSMPIVSKPVEIDSHFYLDGGLVDCIPLKHSQDLGFERNLVIFTQPQGYLKKPNKLAPLCRLVHRKYPKVAELMAVRHIMYNNQLSYCQSQASLGNTLLIFPDHPLNIGRTELNEAKLRSVYQHGYDKAMSMIDEIKKFMNA